MVNLLSSLWQFCPFHLVVLKHKNITTTLPRNQQFRDSGKTGNLLKTKAAILFEMTAVALAAGPGLEHLS
jgi:hypothetical protein